MDEAPEDRCYGPRLPEMPPISRTVSRSGQMFVKAPFELDEYFTAIIAR